MQYPKQSDTAFQSQDKSLKQDDQTFSERERVKLEGRHEAEEEHMSQPSTMHSLGNIDESPSQTPTKSSEILQKGFHKATDAIAQGVEVVKILITSPGEVFSQAKEAVDEKVSSLEGDIKQKAEQAKSKLTEEFGDEIQPEKDLAPEMKEHVKEINEEIKHQPHGEEQIVEGQGHAQPKKSDFTSQKKGEMKEKAENLKEGSKEMMNKAADKFDEMRDKATQKTQPLKEKAQNLPSSSYEKKEKFEEKDITPSDDLRNVSKEILDKALDKIDEMREKAGEKGEQVKQNIKQASSQISEKAEQKTSEFSQSQQSESHHHVEVQQGDQPLTKDAKEEILELAQQITDKIQELKAAGQLSTEQKSQFTTEQHSQQTSATSHLEEGHEHHHLSAESRSFVPTKQSHQLIEKVKEGLDESVSLTEKIEELEHGKQQPQEKGQPVKETLKQGAQNISHKISEKVQDIKENLTPSGQQQEGYSQGYSQYQERSQPSSGQVRQEPREFKQNYPQYQEKGQGVQEASSKLSEKMEDVKSKLTPSSQEPSELKQEFPQYQQRDQPSSSQFRQEPKEFKQNHPQYQEKGQPLSSQIKQGVQEASSKLSEKMEDAKSKLTQSSQETKESSGSKQDFSQSVSQPEGKTATEQIKQGVQQASEKLSEKVQEVKQDLGQKKEEILEERKPLVDKIMGRIHEVSDSFNQKVEGVKSAFRIEENPQEDESQREPLVDIVQRGFTDMTSKISHNIEAVKTKIMPAHHETSHQGASLEKAEKPVEQEPSLKQRLSEGISSVSGKFSQGVGDIKHRLKPEKSGQFHKVGTDEGFTETVEEYRHEISGPPLVSSNPYETLGTKNLTLAQPLGPTEVVGGNLKGLTSDVDKENIHLNEGYIYHPTMMEKIKEGFHERFRKENEEEDIIKEVQEVQEKAQEEKQSLKQKISGSFESLKSKFHSGKEEVQQQATEKISESKPLEKSKEKPIEEKSFEQPLEQMIGASESKSLKDLVVAPFHSVGGKISGGVESLKGKLHSGKEELQELPTDKISKIEPVEKSLEERLEKPSERPLEKPSEKSFEQPLEQLSQASGSKSFKEVIAGSVEPLKSKLHSGKEEVQQQASEKISKVESLEKAWEKPLEKPLKKPNEKSFEQPPEDLSQASESKSFKEMVSAPFQSISGKISGGVESIKSKFHHGKEQVKEGVSQQFEEIQHLDDPSKELIERQKDAEKFHIVKEGIHETVSELKEEEATEPLFSSNPFEPLESKAGDIAQPLNPQDIVGGDLQSLTQNIDQENLGKEQPEESTESKSFLQKLSGGFHEGLESIKAKFRREEEGGQDLSGSTAMISEQFNIRKEKVMSEFSKSYSEYAALFGLAKDLEEKCKSSQDEGNENA